jgi:prephenate dehydratase/chorismate mutase/prephenate dehydratase
MDLTAVRDKINRIDYEIVKLLNERLELSVRTKKLKRRVVDPGREKEVMENISRFSHGLVEKEFTKKLFLQVIAESRRVQGLNLHLVGFQGEHGANCDLAITKFDPQLIPIPCRQFVDVLEGVQKGKFELGVLPVENSLEGAVTEVNDLLIYSETDVKIVGEIRLPVNHCLLATPDTDYREIQLVYSHPQALAQCRGFLQRNKLEARPFYDTAGAAKMLSISRPNGAAAIASNLCAELYNLQVIKENIQDESSNFTRFIVVAKTSANGSGNKCSIIFSTKHEAGALFSVLKLFSDADINLTRIESRPFRSDPGNYAFLLDFKGSYNDRGVKDILNQVKARADLFKFLGCYTEGRS